MRRPKRVSACIMAIKCTSRDPTSALLLSPSAALSLNKAELDEVRPIHAVTFTFRSARLSTDGEKRLPSTSWLHPSALRPDPRTHDEHHERLSESPLSAIANNSLDPSLMSMRRFVNQDSSS